ncbi:MAG: glycerate kinase [Bacteroidetes bacterium]|jgi:glycerate kinase|nr:glycerate kinase [Bacteroidota bacterium]
MSKLINILVAPDKMKGTLSAKQICEIIEDVASQNKFVDSQVEKVKFNCTSLPLADGGDGSLDVIGSILGLQKVNLNVKGPLLEPIKSYFAIDSKGNAYIEMAAAAGLVQVSPHKRNCMHTTSYGFGELINHAISNGIKKVHLFLGGSATCDAGMGMATALGFNFLDKNGMKLQPFGKQMQYVHKIEVPQHLEKIKATEFVTLCDVNSPVLGPNGAAPVFAPQKGASPEDVTVLEKGLKKMLSIMKPNNKIFKIIEPSTDEQKSIETLIGGGAGGGMGLGTHCFLGARLTKGTEEIMRLTKFQQIIKNQDVVITAEGKIDTSTLQGKVPYGVCKSAKQNNIPCYVLGGSVKLSDAEKAKLGATYYYSLSQRFGMEKAILEPIGALRKVSEQMLEDIVTGACKVNN